jgi:hypothetical protein
MKSSIHDTVRKGVTVLVAAGVFFLSIALVMFRDDGPVAAQEPGRPINEEPMIQNVQNALPELDRTAPELTRTATFALG